MSFRSGFCKWRWKPLAMACNVFHACAGGWFGSERIFHVAANSYRLVCWNQVADEDTYVATQESRINMLIQKCESFGNRLEQVLTELKDEIQTVSNETNMVHDYIAGLPYSIVEDGGFLRNGLGLSHQQWVHLATLERANLVLVRVMGSVEYMRGLRQRFVPQGQADETDGNAMGTSDDGNDDGMPSSMQEATTTPSSAESVSGMADFLKAMHLGCLEREELWDANAIQRGFAIFGRDQGINWNRHYDAMPWKDFRTIFRAEGPCH